MKSTVIWSLVLLNAVLVGSLVGRWVEPRANAQARRPAEYLAIPAEVQGGLAGLVYVVDTSNGEMTAIAYDENKKRLDAMPRMNLQAIFTGAGRGAGR